MERTIDWNVLFQYKEGTSNDDVILKIETHGTNYNGEKSILMNAFIYWNDPETMEFYEEVKITKNFITNEDDLIDVINNVFIFLNNSSDLKLSASDAKDIIEKYSKSMADLYLK